MFDCCTGCALCADGERAKRYIPRLLKSICTCSRVGSAFVRIPLCRLTNVVTVCDSEPRGNECPADPDECHEWKCKPVDDCIMRVVCDSDDRSEVPGNDNISGELTLRRGEGVGDSG